MSALAQKPAGIGVRKFSVLRDGTRAVELARKDLFLRLESKNILASGLENLLYLQ